MSSFLFNTIKSILYTYICGKKEDNKLVLKEDV